MLDLAMTAVLLASLALVGLLLRWCGRQVEAEQ